MATKTTKTTKPTPTKPKAEPAPEKSLFFIQGYGLVFTTSEEEAQKEADTYWAKTRGEI